MTISWKTDYSAVLRISGADANSYVQGQFSQDVRSAGPLARYGLWLDHKGRVQADSFVLRVSPEAFLVVSYFCPAPALQAQLERSLVADEVTVTDETAAWTGFGAWGEGAAAWVQAAGFEVPAAGEHREAHGGRCFAGRRSAAPNFEILWPAAERARWTTPATALDAAAFARERIRAGIPAVPDDVGPTDLPQEGGLEDGAISFTKGCFTGQEVMARLKNLGQVRRRLFPVTGTGAPPPPRTALYQGERKAGEIRSAVSEGEGFLALALLSLLQLDRAAGLGLAPGAPAGIRLLSHG